MTLAHQIEEARQALADLLADEVELSKLEEAQAAELHTLRQQGSKDFSHLATLEGKRAALASMLTEQRGHIAQAQTQLIDLEVQAERDQHLQAIGETASQIALIRERLFAGLLNLVDLLTPEMRRLIELHIRWSQLRREWIAQAEQLGIQVAARAGEREEVAALFSELTARGVDVQMLRLSLGFHPEIQHEQTEFLPTYMGQLNENADFAARIKQMTGEWFMSALTAHAYADVYATQNTPSQPTAGLKTAALGEE